MLYRKGIIIMDNILTVKKLSKGSILHDISFEMKQGEMVAVMGPSGSGKSTLLYNVSGMDKADGGKVYLKDTEITGLSEDEKAKIRLNRMGFVFQQMNMMSDLNILDNILLPAIHANKANKQKGGKGKIHLTLKARALMKKMSVSEIERRKITEVSGGQLQRACICRSMINEPEILFADEPTGALNQSAAAEVMAEIAKLNHEGMSVLLVTHDSKVAASCHRILYLLDGSIKGDIELANVSDTKQREEKVLTWLRKMGW